MQLLTVSSAKADVQAFPVGLRKQWKPLMRVSGACWLRILGHRWLWSDVFTRPKRMNAQVEFF